MSGVECSSKQTEIEKVAIGDELLNYSETGNKATLHRVSRKGFVVRWEDGLEYSLKKGSVVRVGATHD